MTSGTGDSACSWIQVSTKSVICLTGWGSFMELLGSLSAAWSKIVPRVCQMCIS